MLILIGILMFLLIVASTWWFGLWSNLVTLVNLLLSAMLASSIYEPIADELAGINGSYAILYDFIAVWLVFVVTFIVLRTVTDTLSGYRLKFDPITEMAGRSILSVWIAGVFICFSFFTMQMGPLAPGFYGDKSPDPSQLGTLPDKQWLAFIQSRSRGALAASKEAGLWPKYVLEDHPDDVGKDMRVFDPHGEFLIRCYQNRQTIANRERLRSGK